MNDVRASDVDDLASHWKDARNDYRQQDGGDKGECARKDWPKHVEVGEEFRVWEEDGRNSRDGGEPSTDKRDE